MIRDALQRTTAVKREYDKVMRTELKLSAEEGKPEDYPAVGRFYALVKGDWKVAMPLMAKGPGGTRKLFQSEKYWAKYCCRECGGVARRMAYYVKWKGGRSKGQPR